MAQHRSFLNCKVWTTNQEIAWNRRSDCFLQSYFWVSNLRVWLANLSKGHFPLGLLREEFGCWKPANLNEYVCDLQSGSLFLQELAKYVFTDSSSRPYGLEKTMAPYHCTVLGFWSPLHPVVLSRHQRYQLCWWNLLCLPLPWETTCVFVSHPLFRQVRLMASTPSKGSFTGFPATAGRS